MVTGGARGIGFEIVHRFLDAGASVAIWEASDAAITEAKAALSKFSVRVSFQKVDVTLPLNCADAAKALPFSVDILINNAGITRDKSFAKMTTEDFEAVVDTCLVGVFNTTKSLLDRFDPKSSNKRIINIASVVALYGNFGQANYVAAKAGVIGLTKTLSRELARKGFTVNAVAPGFISTAMTDLMPAEMRKAIEEKVPVGRLGQTSDISNACMFLASGAASYVNGAVLSVDGGLVI